MVVLNRDEQHSMTLDSLMQILNFTLKTEAQEIIVYGSISCKKKISVITVRKENRAVESKVRNLSGFFTEYFQW